MRILTCSLSVLLASVALADEVYLKNGSLIEGDVSERGARIDVKTSGGVVTLDRAKVDHIVRKESRAGEYARRAALLAKDDAEGHKRLAAWCGEKGLLSESRQEYELVLSLSPNDADARRALGYVRVMGKWVAVRESWAEWETEHFLVRTDTGRAQELADDLEAGVRAFMAAYGDSLVRRPLKAQLTVLAFRERRQFLEMAASCTAHPAQSGDRFSESVQGLSLPADGLMLISFPEQDAEAGREALLHEMTHLLFYATCLPEEVPRGMTPEEVQERLVEGKGFKWFHEGFACYIGGSTFQGDSVRLGDCPADGPTARMAKVVAKAIADGKAVPLGALVEAGQDEFTGADCVLYYAEAWSFVHFLHHGLGGKLRGAFDRLAGEVARGEGGRGALERSLGLKLEDVAPAWHVYVKNLAER